jgi:ribonuclease Z
MMRYGVGFSFRDIFFSHYHSDHILGVTGLIRTMGLLDRTAPVVLYGPRGAQRILGGSSPASRKPRLGGDRGSETGRLPSARRLRPRSLRHRTPGRHGGYALREHIRLGCRSRAGARDGRPGGPLGGLHRARR